MTNQHLHRYLFIDKELQQYQTNQRIEELEFDKKTLSILQKIAKVGIWKLNHLSYDVYLSDELISLLSLNTNSNTMSWESFVKLLDPNGSSNLHGILLEQMILNGKKRTLEHCYFNTFGACSYIKHVCETFRNAIGQPMVTVGLTQDITEERHKTLKLQTLSITDELTGLYNRRKLNETLYELFGDATDFSVILLDIDWFKNVNDTHGHLAGDEVLIQCAKMIRNTFGGSATCGRWGGEEFLIICPKMTLQQATEKAETLRSNFEHMTFSFSGRVTASLGVSCKKHNDTLDTLMVRCDNRLYKAKQLGRNRVCSQNDTP